MFAIFNSRKQYWHVASRQFQPEPYFINSIAEVQMEMKMAIRQDLTADVLCFDEDITNEKAIAYINSLDTTDVIRQEAIEDMHKLIKTNA